MWDKGSERVSGIEVLPITDLSRPRTDVTLRVSGLFRDVFPTLSALFGQAVRALAARDEATDWNPYAGQAPAARVYGPAPGSYGVNMTELSEVYTDEARAQAGEAWLEASSFALEGEHISQDKDGITQRVANADSFVHLQDLTETDLLLANDYATHEAGFAAAKKIAGGTAQLYHLDNTYPENPRARTLREEISRVVHGRAANPGWIAGMQRHGFRGRLKSRQRWIIWLLSRICPALSHRIFLTSTTMPRWATKRSTRSCKRPIPRHARPCRTGSARCLRPGFGTRAGTLSGLIWRD